MTTINIVSKESVRAVCDIIKDIEKTVNNLDFESCLRHVINDLKEYPPLNLDLH